MTRFKISQKLLILLLAVSLGPLLVVGVLLVVNAQNKLRSEAINQQRIAAQGTADRVDDFLGEKTNILIFQSQTSAARQFNVTETQLNLAAMVKQDSDIDRVALVDKTGMERVVVNRDGLQNDNNNVSTSDAFKSATFLAGKEYIGPVNYVNGQPHVTIGVPLIRFTQQQDLRNLSTAEFGKYRSADDIQGVMMADFNLSNLWSSVLAIKIGKDGYAYVVDDKGSLIAHPDSAFLTKSHDLSTVSAVQSFLAGKVTDKTSKSEKGVSVLASYQPITRSNWGVITEEPTASVFASVNSFYRLCLIIFIVVVVVVVVGSLVFRRQLLVPIQMIASGAQRIGHGDFKYKIEVMADDELGDLARSFNAMGGSLESFVHDLEVRNRKLNEERQKQAGILQSVSDGIIAIDANMNVILTNSPAAALIGKKPDELTGKNLSDAFQMMHNERTFMLNLQEPGVQRYDDIQLPYGDKLHYLELVVVATKEMSDVAAIITVHNLTPERELEVMKLDFVAIAAHELRTPLTVVRGYLNDVNHSPEVSKLTIMNIEYLQRAQKGVDELSGLINNILNVANIERNTFQVAFTKVDIANLLNRTLDQLRVSANLKLQHVEYHGPKKNVFVIADRGAITEVVNNLLNNAIKYTSEHGNVSLSLQELGSFVRVEVKDDGRGIPDSAKPHLFTKFYRVENSLTTGNRGTGLGLFISKRIIDLHHGEIGVVSKMSEGSTFFFTLPIFDEEKHAQIADKNKGLGEIHGWFPKHSDS